MAYVSLYRRYRPQSFEEVVGQDHVTRTLTNAIAEDRLHHAYLFTGPRGTGKTSTARLLAKALNCEDGPTPTPCNTCDRCVEITNGSSVDVIELDMASHGGVDDARELRDRALFAPARSRKKVYILDEVHMASTAAFNALLKLIEEPPGHVVFAMATTDPQKVLPTIMSRVQRLDLRRIGADALGAHVRSVCESEGYTIDDAAVEAVVRAGDGSARDTLSVLEQVLSFSGGDVTAAKVAQVLGHTPVERAFEAVELIAARDLGGLFGLVQGLLDAGHDLRRFAFDLLQHLRDLLVLQVAPDRPDLVDATDERRRQLQERASLLPRDSLLRAVDVLAETVAEIRQGPPRLPLELALAKLAVPDLGTDTGGLADRISRLEDARTTPKEAAAATTPSPPSAPAAPEQPEPSSRPATSTNQPEPEPAPRGSTAALAERARRRADADDTAADTAAADEAPDEPAAQTSPPPAEPIDAPEDTGAPAPAPSTPAGDDDLATIAERWDAILDIVKDESRRIHAVFFPAEPIKLRNGILTLRYPKRYASFHAQNAKKGEFSEVLQRAVQRSCGLRIRVDTLVEGESRRPQPAVVTVTDDPAPGADEEAQVREAEMADEPDDPAEAAARAEELLRAELGAEKVKGRAAGPADPIV